MGIKIACLYLYPSLTPIAPPNSCIAQATSEDMNTIWFCFDSARSDSMEISQPHCGASHQNGIHFSKLPAVLQVIRWIEGTATKQTHEDKRRTTNLDM